MKYTHSLMMPLLGAVVASGLFSDALSQSVDPAFSPAYSLGTLGAVPGVQAPYGGLVFKAGSPNKLLIGGNADSSEAAIYEITVTRGPGGHITGFEGVATRFAWAAGAGVADGGIDGGLIYGPNNVLFYTSFPDHTLCEIKPGSTRADKYIRLTLQEYSGSVGSLALVPQGFPGAGRLKILSFGASYWYDTALTPDDYGTYNIGNAGTPINLNGIGPEGAIYVAAGNPGFPKHSVLISQYGNGKVGAYEIDTNGDPIVSTERVFIDSLDAAQGATVDPVTGDFLFSNFTSEEESAVLIVGGFTINPFKLPPTVRLVTYGTNFAAPASIDLFAEATGAAGALISKVEYYSQGTNLIGSSTIGTQFAQTWPGVPAGVYPLTAVAYDSTGMRGTSAVVQVTVGVPVNQLPSVTLTSVGTGPFVACSQTTLTATASDPDGEIALVEFYANNTLLGRVSTAPYQAPWQRMAMGTFQVTARAVDSQGGVSISAPQQVVVTAPATNTLVYERLANGLFAVCLACEQGTTNRIEGSTNLTQWATLTNFVSTNAISEFIDTGSATLPRRFYKAIRP